MKIRYEITDTLKDVTIFLEINLEKQIIYERQNLKIVKKESSMGGPVDFDEYYDKKEHDTFLIECNIHSEAEVLAFKKELKTLINFFKTNEDIAIARDAKLKKAVEKVMEEYSEYILEDEE